MGIIADKKTKDSIQELINEFTAAIDKERIRFLDTKVSSRTADELLNQWRGGFFGVRYQICTQLVKEMEQAGEKALGSSKFRKPVYNYQMKTLKERCSVEGKTLGARPGSFADALKDILKNIDDMKGDVKTINGLIKMRASQ